MEVPGFPNENIFDSAQDNNPSQLISDNDFNVIFRLPKQDFSPQQAIVVPEMLELAQLDNP